MGYQVLVWCSTCGMGLWAALTDKDKAKKISEGSAEGIECSDCTLRRAIRKTRKRAIPCDRNDSR